MKFDEETRVLMKFHDPLGTDRTYYVYVYPASTAWYVTDGKDYEFLPHIVEDEDWMEGLA